MVEHVKYFLVCISMFMKQKFDLIFENILKNSLATQGKKTIKEEQRPMYDDSEDMDAFAGELDPDSAPDSFDTEGLDPSVYSMVDSTTEEIIGWSNKLSAFVKELVDPQNDQAILTKLSKVSNVPEFADAAERVSKPLEKVFRELGAAQAALDTLATLAKSRRDKRKKQDATGGPSGPY